MSFSAAANAFRHCWLWFEIARKFNIRKGQPNPRAGNPTQQCLPRRGKRLYRMSAKNYWLAFGIGVSAGAAIALLYAPQSGARTRKQLRKGVDDASDHLKDAGDYLRAQAERLSDEAQDAIKRARGQASHLVEKAGDRAGGVIETVSDAVSDAVKSARALV